MNYKETIASLLELLLWSVFICEKVRITTSKSFVNVLIMKSPPLWLGAFRISVSTISLLWNLPNQRNSIKSTAALVNGSKKAQARRPIVVGLAGFEQWNRLYRKRGIGNRNYRVLLLTTQSSSGVSSQAVGINYNLRTEEWIPFIRPGRRAGDRRRGKLIKRHRLLVLSGHREYFILALLGCQPINFHFQQWRAISPFPLPKACYARQFFKRALTKQNFFQALARLSRLLSSRIVHRPATALQLPAAGNNQIIIFIIHYHIKCQNTRRVSKGLIQYHSHSILFE